MRIVGYVLVIGWLAFWGYWLISARSAKPGQSQRSRFVGIRVAVVVVIVLLGRFFGFHVHAGAGENWALGSVGLALWLAGLALAVWARLYIGRNWGMPMTRKENPDLVTTGPYRFVRHPIYSGIILALAGSALATAPLALIAAVVLAAYFSYSAVREERYLTEQFPDAYPAYKSRSKMLIPFVF